MRALIIDDNVRREIARVKANAETHKRSLHDLFAILGGRRQTTPPGDDPAFRVLIPFGFKAVYTIEQHPNPQGWCHHLSVSIGAEDRYPHEAAVLEIAKEFGMLIDALPSPNAHVYLEKEFQAVNVLVPLAK